MPLTLTVTVPTNTTATVYVPLADAALVKADGRALALAAAEDAVSGAKFVRRENGCAVLAVESGSYVFEVAN
jgi:hypothetical protein